MKRIFTSLFLLFIFCGAQSQVQQKKMALVTKKTATWCYPCGTWGWELQEEIESDNYDKAVIFELLSSSSDQYLYNSTAAAIQNNFPYTGSYPAWFVNGADKTEYAGGGVYPSITRTNCEDAVDSTSNTIILANCSYTFSYSAGILNANVQTKFFNFASGEYFLGLYIIEDHVVAYQNGIGTSAVHEHVLRAAMSATWYGDKIAAGSIAKNTTYSNSFSKALATSYDHDNVWLAAIIWKKNGSKYEYINAYTNHQSVTSVPEIPAEKFRLTSFPNLVSSGTQLSFVTEKQMNGVTVSVYDIVGKEVKNIFAGQLEPGTHSFPVNVSEMENGYYLLRIFSGNEQVVRKFVVQK